MDYNTRKRYKVYHALRLFGDIVRDYDTICASVTSGNLYVFAASGDGDEGKGATAEERKADYEARLAKRRALFVKFFVEFE